MDDDFIIIAESGDIGRDEEGNMYHGLELFAYDGEGIGAACLYHAVRYPSIHEDELNVPWPDILKHAPVAALVAEMERRKFQVKSEDDLYNDWAEAREAEP